MVQYDIPFHVWITITWGSCIYKHTRRFCDTRPCISLQQRMIVPNKSVSLVWVRAPALVLNVFVICVLYFMYIFDQRWVIRLGMGFVSDGSLGWAWGLSHSCCCVNQWLVLWSCFVVFNIWVNFMRIKRWLLCGRSALFLVYLFSLYFSLVCTSLLTVYITCEFDLSFIFH